VRQRTDTRCGAADHDALPAPPGAGCSVKDMVMSKKSNGNKEAKKPKQAPRVAPPPTGGPNAPTLAGWQKPHPAKK
jgi:hypothetical protein